MDCDLWVVLMDSWSAIFDNLKFQPSSSPIRLIKQVHLMSYNSFNDSKQTQPTIRVQVK